MKNSIKRISLFTIVDEKHWWGVECNKSAFCALKYEKYILHFILKTEVMMKRSVKRFVSLLLVTVMVLSTNVSYAFANEIPASDMSGETIEIQSDLQTVSDSANGDVSGDLNQSEQSSDALSESEPEISEPETSETVTESVITEGNTVVDDSEEGSLTDAKQTLEEDIDTTLESVVEEESEIEEELQSELDSNMPGRYNITDFRIVKSYNNRVDMCFNVDNSVENYINNNLDSGEKLYLGVHMGFDDSELSDKGLKENEKGGNPVGSMSGPCSRILIGNTSNPRGDRNGDGEFYINITDIYNGGTVFPEPYNEEIKAYFSFQFIVLDADDKEVRYGEKTQDKADSCTITSHTTITFDANGGTMSYKDEGCIASEGEPWAYTSETYDYFESNSGWGVSIQNVDRLDPHKEGSVFLGWYDSKDEKYPYDFFPTNETRVYKAKWRDTFKNIPVEFYGTNYTVEKYDPSDAWTLDVDGDTFSFNADEGKTYRLKITPDEGYEFDNKYVLNSSVGITQLYDNGEYYVFNLYELGWRDSAPDKIIIDPAVVRAQAEGEQYSYVIYNPDAAKVIITEENNKDNVIEPVSEGYYYSNRIKGFYLLKTGTNYKVEISCNDNYKFNDYGICVNSYDPVKDYFPQGKHVNTNTRNTYSFTFKAGRKEIWVNSDPLYSPKVKVKNSDGEYKEIKPVNGIYNVKYTDDIKLFLQRGNWTAKLVNKIKDGTKVLNDWYVKTEDNGFWLKFLDADTQKFYKEYYGKTLKVEMYDPENQYGARGGYGPKATFKLKVSTPITSTTVNGVTKVDGRQTLSPAIGEEKVCTVSVNSGASIENLGFMYSDGTTECSFLDTRIENGKLYVKANAGCKAGKTVDIILYDTENPIKWDKQDVTNGKITVTTAAPAWAKTAPTVSLASANDIKLEFNVKAPKGLVLDDNYWIAVKLAPNNKTKTEDSGYSINEDVSYFHVNDDGTIPRIVVNVFKKNDSSIVETLGKGFGTSLDAMVSFMTTEGGANPTETSKILVEGADKKITVATKEPYYADRITLKKGVTKLYAGDKDKIVATVDFGKNATYTTADYWEILNESALSGKGITAAQEDDNKVKISVGDDTPVGKYTVEVGTKGNGVPAKASVQIEVAQTAKTLNVGISQLNIYHNPKKDITAKIKPVMYDQDGKVIKSAKFTYKIEIVKNGETLPATDKTLTVKSGVVKVAKGFVLDSDAEYKLIVTGTVGKTVAAPVTIKIIEANPKIKSIAIGETAVKADSNITLKEYFAIVENLSNRDDKALDYLPATIGLADDIKTDAIVIKEDKGGEVFRVEDLSVIKEVKIPNPAYITKTGKIAISVTTIAGTKTEIKFNIVADTSTTYDALEVSAIDGTEPIEPDAVSAGKIWTVKGSTLQNYVINLKNSSNKTETTKKNISGDKLSVSGAKIVKNWHGDCIQIVMTSKTATITRKHGSTKVGTYYITNDAFDLKAPKVTADRNSKLYTNFGDNQTVNYTLDKVYDDLDRLDHLRISSTNADINEWIQSGNIVYDVLDKKTFSITVQGEASKVKAAKYPITVEFVDGEGASIFPATTTNLEFKTLKKSFKPVTSYTMSDSDMTSVVFKASSSAGVDSIELNSILNDNIKGKYNSIDDILEVHNDTKNVPYLKIKDGKSLASAGKSITGYVKYTVKYADGSHEDKLDKVKINIKKHVRKYTSDTKKILLDDVGESIEGIKVYADKQPVNIVKAAILNPTEKAKVSSLYLVGGKLSITLKDGVVKKPGTVKLTVNVIPEGSLWLGKSPVDEKNSIPVAVKINVAANNSTGKVSVDTKTVYEFEEFEEGENKVVGEYTSNLAVPCDVESISGSLSESGKEYLKAEPEAWGEFRIIVDTDNVPAKKKGKTVRLPITFKFGNGYKDETYTINVKLPN